MAAALLRKRADQRNTPLAINARFNKVLAIPSKSGRVRGDYGLRKARWLILRAPNPESKRRIDDLGQRSRKTIVTFRINRVRRKINM